jgi:hypothetical protein
MTGYQAYAQTALTCWIQKASFRPGTGAAAGGALASRRAPGIRRPLAGIEKTSTDGIQYLDTDTWETSSQISCGAQYGLAARPAWSTSCTGARWRTLQNA